MPFKRSAKIEVPILTPFSLKVGIPVARKLIHMSIIFAFNYFEHRKAKI